MANREARRKDNTVKYVDGILNAWENGREKIHPSMFTDGKDVYSYGKHFPLLVRSDDGTVLLNVSKYSVTTSKQQGDVRYFLSRNGWKVVEEGISTGKVYGSGYGRRCDYMYTRYEKAI